MHLPQSFKRVAYTSLAFTRASVRPRNTSITPFAHLRAARMLSSMAQRLKGKTIVITGASSGIGRSTAIEFAKTQPDDLKLILTARREDTLKEVAKEIEGFAKGVKVLPVKLDVSNIEEVQSFVEKLPQEFKDIDVLVNNAYVPLPSHYLPVVPNLRLKTNM
jgi:NADPH:quinone reductase-like Zn-dependent oxidoreductase